MFKFVLTEIFDYEQKKIIFRSNICYKHEKYFPQILFLASNRSNFFGANVKKICHKLTKVCQKMPNICLKNLTFQICS